MKREAPQNRPRNEFSRPFLTAGLTEEEVVERLAAEPAECETLARRFGLLGLERLAARLVLRRARGSGVVRVIGRLEVRATQACVVTLEPLEADIESDFKVEFAPAPAGGADFEAGELLLDAEAEDLTEPLDPSGVIDLGELVAQQLAVLLDPYPRKAGVAYAAPEDQGRNEGEDSNPFAVLRKPGAGG